MDISHRPVYLVPREWLEISRESLSYILFNQISSHYYKYKTIDGIKINIQGVTTYLQYCNEEFWLRKCQDQRSKPDIKEYYPIYMPCIYCTES